MKILRRALGPTLAMAMAAGLTLVPAAPASAASALQLFTPTTSLTATVYGTGDDAYTDVSPHLYVLAPTSAFEVRLRRDAYNKPISAVATVGGVSKAVPASLLGNWSFKDAFTLTWRSASGRVVQNEAQDWCPNDGDVGRLSPNAAPASRYDRFCVSHPFAKSDRWGIERGWASDALGYPSAPVLTPGAKYTLTVHVRNALASFLGLSGASRDIKYTITAVRGVEQDDPVGPIETMGAPAASPTSASSRTAQALPASPKAAITTDVLPDLVSLPALGIQTHTEGGKDLLDFGATVYNAGQAPLVAEGFRKGSSGVMDAYQFFYRNGQLVTNARVGSMEYDSRPSHLHWHFRDFAVYDLVNGSNTRVGTSGKEAFCLAPTDAINMLQKGAVRDPGDSDLSTACGEASSIWVREVLAAGWGDTYTQARAGQSIDITNLANGTYKIRITANPEGRLREVTRANNVSYRTVILGGAKGARTVKVPAYQLIDSEALIDFGDDGGAAG